MISLARAFSSTIPRYIANEVQFFFSAGYVGSKVTNPQDAMSLGTLI